MKIALIGYGRMGKEVERCALEEGHEIVARFTSESRDFSPIEKADVCIDFTVASSVLETLNSIRFFQKPVVIGTTGWDVAKIERYAEELGILYAPNFSVGITLFEELLKKAATLLLPEYTVTGEETHHFEKKDAPSGTALRFAEQVKGLQFHSVRSGSHVGTHKIVFDSSEDTIELTHRARNRQSFAKGALEAAHWLLGKVGVYTFEDYLKERLKWKELSQL